MTNKHLSKKSIAKLRKTIRRNSKKGNIEYTKRKYRCGFCGYVFIQEVGYVEPSYDSLGRKIKGGTDSVICPMCTNYLESGVKEDG